ncbi:AAA family ATPase [Halococcus sp. IIIV-5B]|uniref:AAA family ATPase n=1 Tax=Halococcus sp. IIIV-5B TaxID=2321230 RepID=UPI001314A33D|nr:AAA family ATPase [Halococcus sp. IIIV-5B]
MEIDEIRVQNYRSAVDTGWMNINEEITTLIGENESGKTSILKALQSFSDQNKYDSSVVTNSVDVGREEPIPIISIRFKISQHDHSLLNRFAKDGEVVLTRYYDGHIEIESLERFGGDVNYIEVIYDHTKFLTDHILHVLINNDLGESSKKIKENTIPNLEEILTKPLERIDEIEDLLGTVQKQLKNEDIDHIDEFSVERSPSDEIYQLRRYLSRNDPSDPSNHLYNYLPSIIYIDDIQPIANNICKNSDRDVDKTHHKQIRDIISGNGDRFRKMERENSIRGLDFAERRVQRYMNQFWEQKRVGISMYHDTCENCFNVLISDLEVHSADDQLQSVFREPVKPSQRSDGFQWFFSFFLMYMAETDGNNLRNKIFLFDDPAMKLHPQGKKNWVSTVENIADHSQVLYTSHSPFLISKDHPSRIRIVEDRQDIRTQVTGDFHEAGGLALEPLRAALGIGLGDSLFVSKRKLLVEGSSDYFIITGLMNYFEGVDEDILEKSEISIMPVDGAPRMPDAAKWVASENISYGILLDSDQEGIDTRDIIEDEYHTVDSDNIVLLEKGGNRGLVIEDMFAPVFYVDCVNKVYEDIVEDFDMIEVTESDDELYIANEKLSDTKITKAIESVFEEHGIGDLDKNRVAKEIKDRLDDGEDVSEGDVRAFKPIFGRLRDIV